MTQYGLRFLYKCMNKQYWSLSGYLVLVLKSSEPVLNLLIENRNTDGQQKIREKTLRINCL